MISFACPGCGGKFQVREELAGKRAKCPRCGQPVRVPERQPLQGVGGDAATLLPRGDRPGEDEGMTAPPPAPLAEGGAPVETSPSLQTQAAPGADGMLAATRADFTFLAPAQAADELGRLGPYRVLDVLGTGGMGVVFRAEDPGLGRPVALKAMLPGMATDPVSRERFLREARTAAAVKHDHVVTIYQVGEDRGVPFLAMEFLEGEPLDGRLNREKILPLAEVLRVGREIALGLDAAHGRGLIHRDIKPANVWLEVPRGRVKILDFGLARAGSQDTQLTQQGAILGTPAYMAPEQANAQPLDHRCDLFSLGCVLYRIATGDLPFKGADAISTLVAVATAQPQDPRELNPALPATLSDLILRLLEKDPARRPPTAAEVSRSLVQIAARPESPAKTVRAPQPPPAPTTAIRLDPAARPRQTGPARGRRKAGPAGLPWRMVLIAAGAALGLAGILIAAAAVRIATDHFSPKRGEQEIVTVRREGPAVTPLQPAPKPGMPVPAPETHPAQAPPPGPAPTPAVRPPAGQAAEPVVWSAEAVSEGRVRAPSLRGLVPSYYNEFTSPKDGPDAGTSKNGGERGYTNGRYWIRHPDKGLTFWNTTTVNAGCALEVVGRILGGPADGWEVRLHNRQQQRGLYIRLTGAGELLLGPGLAEPAGSPQTKVGPIRHPAIWRGQRFNTLLAVIRGPRQVELYVNGVAVCAPVTLARDFTPRGVMLGLHSEGAAEAQFERVGVWPADGFPGPRMGKALEEELCWPRRAVGTGRIPAPDLAKAPLLFQDDFHTPNGHWPRRKTEGNEFRYAHGTYHIGAKAGSAYAWLGQYRDFACEVRGRLTEAGPGRWGIAFSRSDGAEPYLRVGLSGEGDLEIGPPAGVTSAENLSARQVGPIRHRAIKPGAEYNTLLVVSRDGLLEVYVNGVAAAEPIATEANAEPCWVGLISESGGGPSEADFSGMKVWSAAGLPPPQARGPAAR
jgi:serine/threonine protein kinase